MIINIIVIISIIMIRIIITTTTIIISIPPAPRCGNSNSVGACVCVIYREIGELRGHTLF